MANDLFKKNETSSFIQCRSYRYPPLLESVGDDLFDDNLSGNFQQEFDNGYQAGVEKGHTAGYQDGLNQGLQAGLTQGLEQGKAQGYQEGFQLAKSELTQTVVTSNELLAQIQQTFQNHVKQQSEMIATLVTKVARQVIRAELTLQPGQLINLIEETLNQLPETTSKITIHLNPQDSQRLKDLVPEQISAWELIADDTISIGSCRVLTEESEAYADSEERLATCIEAVKESLSTDA